MAAEEAEIKAMAESESQLRDAVVPPTIPVTVIIGTGPDAAPTAITRQRTLASRFPSAKIVEAKKSGHMVQLDEPEVIVESIRQMLR
jgi:pimeloyl-ACP methyl ester carboxylesterase